jgi:hypothetical protein
LDLGSDAAEQRLPVPETAFVLQANLQFSDELKIERVFRGYKVPNWRGRGLRIDAGLLQAGITQQQRAVRPGYRRIRSFALAVWGRIQALCDQRLYSALVRSISGSTSGCGLR